MVHSSALQKNLDSGKYGSDALTATIGMILKPNDTNATSPGQTIDPFHY